MFPTTDKGVFLGLSPSALKPGYPRYICRPPFPSEVLQIVSSATSAAGKFVDAYTSTGTPSACCGTPQTPTLILPSLSLTYVAPIRTSRPVLFRDVPFRPVLSRSVPFRLVPARSVPSRPFPSPFVPPRPVPFRHVPFRPLPSRPVPFRSVPFRSVPFRSVTSRSFRSFPSRHVPSRQCGCTFKVKASWNKDNAPRIGKVMELP